MPSTLAALFLAHVLADYVFQTRTMVANKRAPKVLLGHALVVLLTAMACVGQMPVTALLIVAGAHLAIDTIKSHLLADTAGPHVVDQTLHLATLALVAILFPALWHDGAWGAAPAWVAHAMLLLAGFIYVTRAGGFAVGMLMARFDETEKPETLPQGGFLIGTLERGLIFLLMLGGMAAGIGFLVAAKSVLRFEATQNSKMAEYVIIGTLASFGWAIAVTIGVMALRDALPSL
ncbi:DUF3307 domain-containing protein [Celeribacter arenosi]|uniref:DUF3307 domain-containing protein n=1 Tax=Celeribacter arenosi TaxID=792649 RepID=A0ABP7KF19_9RHOB